MYTVQIVLYNVIFFNDTARGHPPLWEFKKSATETDDFWTGANNTISRNMAPSNTAC